jgi:hypothetical protein
MAPSTTKQWTVKGKGGFDALNFDENASIPEIGDKDVLVKGMQLSSAWPTKAVLTHPKSMPLRSTFATWQFPTANTRSQSKSPSFPDQTVLVP